MSLQLSKENYLASLSLINLSLLFLFCGACEEIDEPQQPSSMNDFSLDLKVEQIDRSIPVKSDHSIASIEIDSAMSPEDQDVNDQSLQLDMAEIDMTDTDMADIGSMDRDSFIADDCRTSGSR